MVMQKLQTWPLKLTLVKPPILLSITKKNSTIVLTRLFLANHNARTTHGHWKVNTYKIIPTSLISLQGNGELSHVAKHECEHSMLCSLHRIQCPAQLQLKLFSFSNLQMDHSNARAQAGEAM